MFQLAREIFKLFRFVSYHPLCRDHRFAAYKRVLMWQFASRIFPFPVAIPFTSKTALLMVRGMNGATGNYYCGLDEFEDMAFILHLLRPHDLFVDIGANIGSYSILASGHAGAACISVEPLPSTFARLRANVRYNNLDNLVQLFNCGISDKEGKLKFTASLDTVNHVATSNDSAIDVVEVPTLPMDRLLNGHSAQCIKIDVEGFEKMVIDGGRGVLNSDSLRVVIMELNGSGARYEVDEAEIHQAMLSCGFLPFKYDPFQRELVELLGKNSNAGNTLYIRDITFVKKRLLEARVIDLPWRSIGKPV